MMKKIKAKVHRLYTEGLSPITKGKGEYSHILHYDPEDEFVEDDEEYPIHLYITTDEEIKKGDWYVLGNLVRQALGNLGKPDEGKFLKIIATTDPSISAYDDGSWDIKNHIQHPYTLPQPSQDFIKSYCESGGIDEVLVEYWEGTVNKPKTDADNCIIIHPVEERIYSEEDMEKAFYAGHQRATGDGRAIPSFDKWIKEINQNKDDKENM
jgi:hypothetical protein